MATSNRAALLTKVHKTLKKHYKVVGVPAERTVLDHLLFACCLENTLLEIAADVFARLQQQYFDWNEVRVSTVTELAETMADVHNPMQQASHLKRCLHSVYEAHFKFDLEPLKKQNLGKSEKQLEAHGGVTPFVLAYTVQHALGGHSIPVDRGVVEFLSLIEAITPAEAEKGVVPGLERAIPKNKGQEFGELIHHFGAELLATPQSPRVKTIVGELCPAAKGRLPKQYRPAGFVPAPAPPEIVVPMSAKAAPAPPPEAAPKKGGAKAAAPKPPPPAKGAAPAKAAGGGKSPPAEPTPPAEKKGAEKKPARPAEAPPAAKRKAPAAEKTPRRSTNAKLTKKKPR